MSNQLFGRRILITGAASGIGLATAKLFRAEGAHLAILDVNGPKLREVGEALSALPIEVDLRESRAVESAVTQASEMLGGLDGVVNCAGIMSGGPLTLLTPDEWRKVLDINLTAPYLICRAALKPLQQTDNGTIVNVASAQALLPNSPGFCAYAASKGGLLTFTRALAAELAPRIRVNAVCPGVTNTPMATAALPGYSNIDEASFVQQYAMRRAGRPEEIAQAILFLTSTASSYITGTAMPVDGGRTFH
jgi:NAD(P)-dependent dehydrogenase (short-subunit alcohol dehydrogenase family)